jgi:HYD1 signature containing ADP-ribosyltransferase
VNATDSNGHSSVPSLSAAQVKAAVATHPAPKNVCPLVPTDVGDFDGSVTVLWHFSSVSAIYSILKDQMIDAGAVSGPHARFGQGVYATDITPNQASRAGPNQTSLALYNRTYVTDKVEAFVGFETDGLSIGASFPSYNQARFPGSTNFYIPGSVDLHGRVVAFGTVYY